MKIAPFFIVLLREILRYNKSVYDRVAKFYETSATTVFEILWRRSIDVLVRSCDALCVHRYIPVELYRFCGGVIFGGDFAELLYQQAVCVSRVFKRRARGVRYICRHRACGAWRRFGRYVFLCADTGVALYLFADHGGADRGGVELFHESVCELSSCGGVVRYRRMDKISV